jgi:hypothetical protein
MPTYKITVFTGDVDNAGTDANVFITLFGQLTNSHEFLLDNSQDNFERGKADVFQLSLGAELGPIYKVRIRHDDSGDKAGWYLDKIIVHNETTGKDAIFPCYNWLARDEGDRAIDRELTPQ